MDTRPDSPQAAPAHPGSGHPAPAEIADAYLAAFYAGAIAATLAIGLLIWLSYGWSDRVVALLGHSGARIVSRLTAFILLCVGVQIIATGAQSLIAMVLAPAQH